MEASPMLSEHQAPEQVKKDVDQYNPTPEERKAVKLAQDVLRKNKRHRQAYDREWIENYRMFRGRQWKEMRPSYRHSEVLNFIFRTIQSNVPLQTDIRPRFEFLPQEPQDTEVAQIIATVSDSDWTTKNWSAELLEVLYDSNIYGTGCSEMEGEPNEIDYYSRDPVYCFPAPSARDTNKDCPTFVYAEPKDIAWIKRKHPDKAKYIKANISDYQRDEKTRDDILFRSPADRNMVMEGSTPTEPNKDLALYQVTYLTADYCCDDFDEEERNVTDPSTGEPVVNPTTGQSEVEYIQKARYPNGRRIITCGNVLLADEPMPYDDGEIPFDRYPNYVLPREFWGMSEVEQLKGPQRTINKIFSFALDVLTLTGNPIWLIPTSSGVEPDALTNRPGLNVEYDGDTPPQRVEGTHLQPYVLQLFDKISEIFDSIAGSQDITRGVQPTGVTAAQGISMLQDAAQTRIRQKQRNLDSYLQNVGQKYKSRVFQFYAAPRIVRLTGDEGASRYFRMQVSDSQRVLEDGQTMVPSKTLSVVPYTDAGGEDLTNAKQYQIIGDFDVKVSTGSSLPFEKQEREQKLLNYFDRGIIDAEEVLKGTDYPNYQAVLQRVQDQKAAAAQAQMASKAGPPTAPPQALPA